MEIEDKSNKLLQDYRDCIKEALSVNNKEEVLNLTAEHAIIYWYDDTSPVVLTQLLAIGVKLKTIYAAAAEYARVEALEWLLDKHPIADPTRYLRTVINEVASHGYNHSVEWLLGLEYDLVTGNKKLAYLAAKSGRLNTVMLVHAAGADFTKADDSSNQVGVMYGIAVYMYLNGLYKYKPAAILTEAIKHDDAAVISHTLIGGIRLCGDIGQRVIDALNKCEDYGPTDAEYGDDRIWKVVRCLVGTGQYINAAVTNMCLLDRLMLQSKSGDDRLYKLLRAYIDVGEVKAFSRVLDRHRGIVKRAPGLYAYATQHHEYEIARVIARFAHECNVALFEGS